MAIPGAIFRCSSSCFMLRGRLFRAISHQRNRVSSTQKISFLCFQWLGFSQVPCSNMQPAWLRPCGLDECQFLSLPATPRRVWSWWSIPGDDPKFTFLLGGLKISSQTTKSGWWFGTWILFSPIVGILGWWSNLTNSIIFQGGRYTTNEKFLKTGVQNDSNTTKLNK